MKRKPIISVSRRTDVPAFYGDWFMHRLKAGFASYRNPFNGQTYSVSLKREDVSCFVFWSKNYLHFLKHLPEIKRLGYGLFFNFTITALPRPFENNVVDTTTAINTLKQLSDNYSPRHLNWRYDPIVISDITGYDHHKKTFEQLARQLEGHVHRCYISFVNGYGKVKRAFEVIRQQKSITVYSPEQAQKLKLLEQLSEIATAHGMNIYSCCDDTLVQSSIKKGRCIDGNLIASLYPSTPGVKKGPTRKECGCTESIDIGAYDTCPHGCTYCYANSNIQKATSHLHNHNILSETL
ncbi:MAG: DUF1848 domain-containing protein [Fibrobacteria bacterium]|nr:DUF1848 domain-containing protein [Fibrobacteria bacterium]